MSVTISDDAARFLHQLLDLARFNGADGKLQAAMVQQELEHGLAANKGQGEAIPILEK